MLTFPKPKINVPDYVLASDFDEIMASGQFAEGKFTRSLEDAVSKLYNRPALAISNAGTGLEAVLRFYVEQLDAKKWVVQSNTFYATGAAVVRAGGMATIADCDPETFCLSYDYLNAFSPLFDCGVRVFDGVVLVHIGGSICRDYSKIAAWCSKYSVALVEDAAHALGSTSEEGLMAGFLGAAAVFSFYPTKAVPAGDGGVIVFRNEGLRGYVERYRNYSKYSVDKNVMYDRSMFGTNFRISEWNAAIAYRQVRRLPEILERRTSDAVKLMSIVGPPLIGEVGCSNFYKFISKADPAIKKTVGKVYRSEDQLHKSLPSSNYVEVATRYPGCDKIAASHICLPLGEDHWADVPTGDLEKWLTDES